MLTPNTYIHVEYWMVELELKLTELFIFAIIHGFSHDGKSYYSGSQKYFRIWTRRSKSTVIKALKTLQQKGLIVKKVIRIDDKLYNTYYTTESRKPVTEKFATTVRERMSSLLTETQRSENQTSPKIRPNGSENQTYGVQFSDPKGMKTGHNNNIYNINNNAADSSGIEIDSVIKAYISKKLIELFGAVNVFDSKLVDDIEYVVLNAGVNDAQVGDYIQSVFEKTVAKKPDSIPNLFRKLVCAPDVVKDYILKNPKPKQRTIEYITCPICSTDFEVLLGYCPSCSLPVEAIRANNKYEISICSAIKNMTLEQRASYDDACDKVAKSKGRIFLTPEEKIELLREQGFLHK